jgi:broad specificity phosphatase PhoE
MTRRITLIRHAETAANVHGGWQGHSDSELSDRGYGQIAKLAARFRPETPSLLITSDLGRAISTADALGSAEPDPRWREFHFGEWEGLRSDEIEQRFPGGLLALRSGDDFRPEGGESQSEFAARIQEALAAVVLRLDDGDEAMVVTHGGLIHSLISSLEQIPGRWRCRPIRRRRPWCSTTVNDPKCSPTATQHTSAAIWPAPRAAA